MDASDARWEEFRRELSARVAAFAPNWTERAGHDPGVSLVELRSRRCHARTMDRLSGHYPIAANTAQGFGGPVGPVPSIAAA